MPGYISARDQRQTAWAGHSGGFFQFSRTIMPPYRRPTKRGIGDYCAGYQVFACMYVLDLEIDRVERIDSTRLKIDRLDRSTRLASHCL